MADLLERLRSPAYLPTTEEVQAVCKSYSSVEESYGDGKTYLYNSVTTDDFSILFPEWNAYEILTKEFIASFAGYIASQIAKRDMKEPCTILELGAGTGRLAHFLKRELEERVPDRFSYHATDNGSEEIPDQFGMVEPLDYVEALEKHKPHIVLVSWMPYEIDWSKSIRRTPTVDEYILIGEAGGCVGHEWATWGYETRLPSSRKRRRAPWLRDCFVLKTLREVSNLQINHRAESRGRVVDRIRSRTFSFRRMRKNGAG